MLRRLLITGLAVASLTLAQSNTAGKRTAPPDAAPALSGMAALAENVQSSEAAWVKLARGMEEHISRLLPCDPTALGLITEAGKASDVRMAALERYLKALKDEAALARGSSRIVAEEVAAHAAMEAQMGAEIEKERAGLQVRRAQLDAGVALKPGLSAARGELQTLQSALEQRKQAQAVSVQNALPLFTELAAVLEKRDAALAQEMETLQEEQTRWKGYYAARLARARVECSVTGGASAGAAKR